MVGYAQDVAKELLYAGCVQIDTKTGFTLTSGRTSPVYVDVRRLMAFRPGRNTAVNALVDLILADYPSLLPGGVAGGETAGIPWAAWVVDNLDNTLGPTPAGVAMAYVRKKPKGHGRMARIEGGLADDGATVLVEDLATDGASKLDFVHALREAGAHVDHAYAVLSYGDHVHQTLARDGVTFRSVCTMEDVLQAAERFGYTREQTDAVRTFIEGLATDGST